MQKMVSTFHRFSLNMAIEELRLHYHGLDVEVQKYKVILYADDQFLMIINKTT